MKKTYCQPVTGVAEVVMESQILAGSGGGAPAQAPGVNGSRSGYGEGIDTWE